MAPGTVRKRLLANLSDKFARLGLNRPGGLVVWTIAVGTLIRFAVAAAGIDLGRSEAYYIATSRHFALSYFDHPPLSFWMAWTTMQLTGSDWLPILRAPFILMFIVTTWLLYRLGATLFDERAGAFAALLLNLSPLFTISMGAWIEPDGPLLCFLLATIHCIVRIAFGPATLPRNLLWAAAGFCLGLAMLAKYYAFLLPVGLGLFAMTSRDHRRWFREPGPYLAAVVALAVFSPVLIWNWQNDWVSFKFHGARTVEDEGIHPLEMLVSILGQAALIGPWIWVPLIDAWVRSFARGPKDSKTWFLTVLAAVPISLFTLAAVWVPLDGHFHWQAPGYLLIFPLLGLLVVRQLARNHLLTKYWLVASSATILLVIGVLGSHGVTGWLRLLLPTSMRASIHDPILRGVEWKPLRPAIAARGLLQKSRLFVVSPQRSEVGKIDLELGRLLPVVCLCPDPRNMAFGWNAKDFLGWDALIVTSGEFSDVHSAYNGFFRKIEPFENVDIRRGGEVVLTVHTYYATDYYRPYPLQLHAASAEAPDAFAME